MGRLSVIVLATVTLGIAPLVQPGASAAAKGDTCDTPVAMSFIDGPLCKMPILSHAGVGTFSTKQIVGTNADGSQFRVTYFTTNYANDAEADFHAQMHLAAIMAAYANETSWGFVSADPDRIMDLTLDGCDCIFGGFDVNIHMFPRVADIFPLLPGLAYRSDPEAAQIISGHELFHHMQYSIQQWHLGSWLVEGMARFSETMNVPDGTFLPTTLTYWHDDNGMNGFIGNPARSISQHAYDWSIVWGYLYANEGGVALIKAILQETANVTGGDVNVVGPAAIQRAMDRTPGGAHATFEAMYRDFAKSLITHANFSWGAPNGAGVHDWSTYFIPVPRIHATEGAYSSPQWAIQFHDAKPTSPTTPVIQLVVAGPLVEANIYTRTGTTSSFATAQPVNTISGVDDAMLMTVRVAGVAGDTAGAGGRYAVVTKA